MKSLVLCFIIFVFTKPLFSEGEYLQLYVEPSCYIKDSKLDLFIMLPFDEVSSFSNCSLKISISGTGISIQDTLFEEQISARIVDNEHSRIHSFMQDPNDSSHTGKNQKSILYSFNIGENTSGNLKITITFSCLDRVVAVLNRIVHDQQNCNIVEKNGITEPALNNNTKRIIGTDYRERFFHGEIAVEDIDWDTFPILLKAERVEGGQIERTRIKVRGKGKYKYRLGNLYPGEYYFEIANVANNKEREIYKFEGETLSRNVNFELPRITPMNLGVYDLRVIDIIYNKNNTFLYKLKAYICRFDSSPIKATQFSWRCGAKYYYVEETPEKNRCFPVYPEPMVLQEGEEVTIEIEVNPKTTGSDNGKINEYKLIETDYTDNITEIRIKGDRAKTEI